MHFGMIDGKLRSTNTDVEGFLADLDAATPGWDRGLSTAVVLWRRWRRARAVIFALLAREVQRIYIINRTEARAKGLQKKFGTRLQVAAWKRNDRLCLAMPEFWSIPPAWYGWAAAARIQSPLSGVYGCRRSGLRSARDRAACLRSRSRTAHRRWPTACFCVGRSVDLKLFFLACVLK